MAASALGRSCSSKASQCSAASAHATTVQHDMGCAAPATVSSLPAAPQLEQCCMPNGRAPAMRHAHRCVCCVAQKPCSNARSSNQFVTQGRAMAWHVCVRSHPASRQCWSPATRGGPRALAWQLCAVAVQACVGEPGAGVRLEWGHRQLKHTLKGQAVGPALVHHVQRANLLPVPGCLGGRGSTWAEGQKAGEQALMCEPATAWPTRAGGGRDGKCIPGCGGGGGEGRGVGG